MAADENIGGVSVSITGDYSELQRDFAAAESIAKSAGEKIGTAFDAASAGAYDFTTAAQKVVDTQKALDAAVVQAKGALVDIRMAFEQGAASAETLARAEQNVEDATKKAVGSFAEIKPVVDQTKSSFASFADGVGNWIKNPLESAGNAAKGFLTALGPMGTIAVGVASGIAALGKEITELVLAEGAAAEKTQNFADRLQLSFQETKHLSEMADIAGVSVGVLERTSQRLATAFEDSGGAGKKVALALDGIGIAADGTGQTLVKVLEHLASMPTASERIAAAHAIMGRGAVELEPLLKNYASLSAAVEKLGGQLSNEMVAKLLAADDAAGLLSIAWGHLKESLASTFAPAVTGGLEILTRMISSPGPPKLEEQIRELRQEISLLEKGAGAAAVNVAKLAGGGFAGAAGMSGLAPSPANLIALKQAALATAELAKAQEDAAKRSADYANDLAKADRASELYHQGDKKRAKEFSDAWKKAFSDLGLTDFTAKAKQLEKDFQLISGSLNQAQIAQALQKIADAWNEVDAASKKVSAQYDKAATAFQKYLDKTYAAKAKEHLAFFSSPFSKSYFKDWEEYFKIQDKFNKASENLKDAGGKHVQEALGSKAVQDVLALVEAEKAMGVARHQAFEETLRQNEIIQNSNIETITAKVDSERRVIDELRRLREAETEGRLKNAISLKEITGQSATAEIIALENIRLATERAAEATHRWGRLYVDLIGNLRGGVDSIGRSIAGTLVGSLWGNDKNDDLDRQGKEFQASLAERGMDFAEFQAGIAAQIEAARRKSADNLAGDLDDLKQNLAEKQAAYDEYAADIANDLDGVREKSAKDLADDLADLQARLDAKQAAYDEYVLDIADKIQRLTEDDAAALAEQLTNLEESLADKRQSYEDYVADANLKLSRIGEDYLDNIQDQTRSTQRHLADRKTSYSRDEADTLKRIDRLKAAGKKESDEEIQDLRLALARKKQDLDEDQRRQLEDLADYTEERRRQALRQSSDVSTNLGQATREYNEFYATNRATYADDIAKHKAALDRKIADLQAALAKQAAELEAFRLASDVKAADLILNSALRLAEDEKKLADSLARRLAELEKYKLEAEQKAAALQIAAALKLADEEADLVASLAKKAAEYEKYKLEIAGKLQELKDAHMTVWDEIAEKLMGPNGVFQKIATGFAEVLIKPLTKAIGDFLAGSIADMIGKQGLGGIVGILGGGITGSGEAGREGGGILGGISQGIGEGSGEAGGIVGSVGNAVSRTATSLLGTISQISTIVSAVAGVAGAVAGIFQTSETNTTLDKIEKATRYSESYLFNIVGMDQQWLPMLGHLVPIWGNLGDANNHLIDIAGHTESMMRSLLNLETATGSAPGAAPDIGGATNLFQTSSTRSANIVIQAFDPASRSIGRGLIEVLQDNGIYR